ncbi:MAG TPA: MSMEG_0567/Sll0786 family nitrogen starvation N-acetyltransferase [Acidimicrobiia bacterium]|jgi:putative N-acetyltransferase (TIGR04045 family)|nr:MSMEG_0567/Sll0786 family nitrogen starvation N-acetyltransferase [Acidimicrobiia bacterium]
MPRPEIVCRPAADPYEAGVHHRIRHEIFVLEQEVFAASDVDAQDASDRTIKVVAWMASPLAGWEPGGAVRLYPLGGGDGVGGVWQGDRLAVLAPFRAWNLGGSLVRFAVEVVASLGGCEMVAHVQTANVRFFERLGWRCRGEPEIYVGLPHQLMAIDLTAPAAMRHRRAPVEGRSPVRS